MTAPGTMGTRTFPAGNPTPRDSKYSITPAAASRPKALPPLKKIACTRSTT